MVKTVALEGGLMQGKHLSKQSILSCYYLDSRVGLVKLKIHNRHTETLEVKGRSKMVWERC